MMYETLVKRFTKLEILSQGPVKIHRKQLTVMFASLFFGGTTNVILSHIIMLKRLQKIQPIRGSIFVGKRGGTPLFEIHIYSMTWFIPCT